MTARPVTARPVTARPVLTRPVLNRKEAPVSRYRRWNELLELLATSGQLQVEDAAKALGVSAATAREVDVLVTDAGIAADDRARLEDQGVEVVLA
ncbi:MAG TPA: DeoR family transcriptional regulator [Streptosporangiaceae bacterium]|jgi:DeoR/GlpR family transcriptional regulator of sugar metabolism|nr:DeoR family transcriptional regulator [Streptosporangiaceae bacterium]